jgi:hypothetical protein
MFVVTTTMDDVFLSESKVSAFRHMEELVADYYIGLLKYYEEDVADMDPGDSVQIRELQKIVADGCIDESIEWKLAFWMSTTKKVNDYVCQTEFFFRLSDSGRITFSHNEDPEETTYKICMQHVSVAE